MSRLALILVVACSRGGETKPETIRPDPAPVDRPPAPVAAPADDRTLVLEQHAPDSAEAHYLAVTLTDGKAAPAITALGKRPAIESSPGEFRTAVAQHGTRWVHARENTKLVIETTAGGKPPYEIDLGTLEPIGLHLVNDALFVGTAKSVCWVDLAAAKPTCVELVKRDMTYKAYDRFVREANRLLAIDDKVMPMFADWFALDGNGRPVERLGDWTLPGVINGHYEHAAVSPTGPGAYTLFLIAPYSIRSGDGHDLAALPIRGDKVVFDSDLTLQNADGKTPIVEEHEHRSEGKQPRLLAGSELTAWTGLAVSRAANQVLIAAGTRGLLTLPADFAPGTSRATPIDLGGPVHDVREHALGILVLVGAELVVLDAKRLVPIARHALPAAFDRFVD